MSYAGVESEKEYVSREYGLMPKHLHQHCGNMNEHGTHTYGADVVCTGNKLPRRSQDVQEGKHKGEYRGE